MGHEMSHTGEVAVAGSATQPWSGKLKPKTNFHYIHPIKCELDEHIPIQEQSVLEIDIKTHEAEYWEIQNNQEEPSVNSKKDLQKIEEIKVRWNEFIKMKKKNYLEDYAVLKQIGRGGFGCVHKVKARYTGLYRAAKRIKKAQLKKAEHQKLFQQMAIMMSLDHPNIAKLYEVYDYKSYYVLVLELCQGGELFKKIVTKQLTQQSSARVMKQILWTLIYLHKKGIVHRDLKPENMLFQLDSEIIKIIDFGIAVKKKPDQVLTARLGTPYYIAPEVLCKNYGEKCDIWSAGVILFMMIAGYPPFRGDNEYEVMQNVLKESVSFKGSAWTKASTECKQLIGWMLKKNPEERASAEQAFNHPWIKKVVQRSKHPKQELVISNLNNFSFQNKLQAVVYTYIVSQLLTSDEKKFLFQTFKELDKNNDGVIQSAELYEALKSRKDISEERVKLLMRIIDTNGSGHIDYTEFLVAGLDPKKSLNEHHFQQAFQYFDIDHSGAITFEEIAHFLQDTKQSQESIKKIFQQVDQNNDGNISKEEFVKLLMQETKRKMSIIELGDDKNKSIKTIETKNNDPNKVKSKEEKVTQAKQIVAKKEQTTVKRESAVKKQEKESKPTKVQQKPNVQPRKRQSDKIKANETNVLKQNQNQKVLTPSDTPKPPALKKPGSLITGFPPAPNLAKNNVSNSQTPVPPQIKQIQRQQVRKSAQPALKSPRKGQKQNSIIKDGKSPKKVKIIESH